ncbi:MAG: polysaccharide deacetylase family protein [Bacteroidota bacterium]
MYLSAIPKLLRQYYSRYVWKIDTDEKKLYLTFDDGPTPDITEWVLSQLEKYEAKASFFLIGDKVRKYPEIVHQLIDAGHSLGNHTQNHIKGRKTDNKRYLKNFLLAQKTISEYSGYRTDLFRPPYGSINNLQAEKILQTHRIIMMDVISGDFDRKRSPEICAKKVIKHAKAGSIVLFHDSEKAWPRLQTALPIVLEHFSQEGYQFEEIPAHPPLMKIEREMM